MKKQRRVISVVLSVLLLMTTCIIPVNAAQVDTLPSGYYNQSESYATYSGNDLGATYTPTATTFKVWAPSATAVQIKRYTTGSDSEQGAAVIGTQDLTKNSSNGVWSLTISGDLKNTYYTYLVTVNGKTQETQDVYSTATGVNGSRSMVVDLNSTDPDGWSTDSHVLYDNQTDSSIWEVHIRDFSISSTSGVSAANRGKYLAFTEGGTKLNGSGDVSTCIDYLVEQGVKTVHLNPAFDFGSVDETKLDTAQYNWGYDPVNYNVPEGSYSSNPYDGNVRIKEFKEMVQALHDRGISVVMDVVYNHTYSTASCFEKTVPGYYYRMSGSSTFLNGTGCGNVTASDKTMFRKYMIDSVSYWANEYHIDGFRFDLMGCHDVTTMNQLRGALDKIDSRIIVYGEPWMADWAANGISTSSACIMDNAGSVSSRVGMFSDKIRNALKGGTSDATTGYIQGSSTVNNAIKAGMMGGSSTTFGKWAQAPEQCVTYDSAHDNYTLWDKLLKSNGVSDYNTTSSTILAQNKLSAAIVLTSQGIPFIMAGEEFARTKYGDENSYTSPDSVNQIDWTRAKTYSNLAAYYKGLNQIRNAYSPFRDNTTASANTTYFVENGSAIGYTMQNKTANASKEWGTVAVLTNNSSYSTTLTLQGQSTLPSSWTIVADGNSAGLTSLGTVTGSTVTVPARTAMVLVDSASFASKAIKAPEIKTMTVKHVDSNGNLLKTTTAKYKVGTTYRAQADNDLLFDYQLVSGVSSTGSLTGTVSSDITVTFTYKSDGVNSYNLTTKYVDAAGNNLIDPIVTKRKDSTAYETYNKTITGYQLDTTKLPGKVKGNISADTTITYTYVKTAATNLKVHWYNGQGWSTPYIYVYSDSSSTITGKWPGSAMTSEGSNWWTYKEVSADQVRVMFTNGAASGTLQEPGQNQPGYLASGEVWIQNGVTQFNSTIVVSYIDETGKKLNDDKTITGSKVTQSTAYTTEAPTISGYGTPYCLTQPSGNWTVGVTNIVYVYPKGGVDPTEPTTSTTATTAATDTTATTTPQGEKYMVGDANGDNKISMLDSSKMANHIADISELTGIRFTAADVNGDGKITMKDIAALQNYLSDKPDSYGIGTYKNYTDPTSPTVITEATTSTTEPTTATTEPTTATTEPTTATTEPTTASDTVKIYFSNSQNWSGTISLYYWNTGDTPVKWPGTAMIADGQNEYGQAIYYLEIPSKYKNIIFTNGTSQSKDYALDGTATAFYCDGSGNVIPWTKQPT